MAGNSIERWRPELRRAIMRVRPEFFSWTPRKRERYGANLPEEDKHRLDQALMKELFGARVRSWRRDASGGKRIPFRELNRWNETILPLVGIGDDCFYLNEWLGKNKTILDFPSLRDYDEDDYRYQETVRTQNDPSYAGKAYRGSLYLSWARQSRYKCPSHLLSQDALFLRLARKFTARDIAKILVETLRRFVMDENRCRDPKQF